MDDARDPLLPYREAPQRRFVCLVCYQSSPVGGTCPRCDVPFLDFDNRAVREQVRFEAERRLERQRRREEGPLFLLAMILCAPALWVLQVPLLAFLAIALAFPVEHLLARAYARLFPRSALATYAARLEGVMRECSPPDPRAALPARAASGARAEDPAQLEAEALLRWLAAERTR